MLKKSLLILGSFLILAALGAQAHATPAAPDFSLMSPTVKVTSYKKTVNGHVVAYGSGSGTVISQDGLIVTNHHVIFDDNEQRPLDAFEVCLNFNVQQKPTCRYMGELVAKDKDLDVALLKLRPQDIFGNPLPALKTLSYKSGAAPQEGSKVQIIGYPASGGETVTISAGQISGFENYNEFKYFKTDTDFDHGSSGGTALDSEGHYIGIPTYIRTYAENVGYFLDIREAAAWIDAHVGDKPQPDAVAEDLLKQDLIRLEDANESHRYITPGYPSLSVTLPGGWEFQEISPTGLYAEQEKLTNPAGLGMNYDPYPYAIGDGYLKKLEEQFKNAKERFPDYKKEDVTFAGQKAWKITYTSYNRRQTIYYIPYGYTLVSLYYSIDLEEQDKQTAALKPVLDSIEFLKSPQSDPKLTALFTNSDPDFSVEVPAGWRIQREPSDNSVSRLAQAVQENNFDGSFTVDYEYIAKDEQQLSPADQLKQATDSYGGYRKVVYQKDDAVFDGLPGWILTTEYPGEDYQEVRKKLEARVISGDHRFVLSYDDKSAAFDKNLDDVRAILSSFSAPENPDQGHTDFGTLKYDFTDIQNHPYAQAILELKSKGILSGYPSGLFQPEKEVTRAEALKIILESRNAIEKDKGLGKEVNFEDYRSREKLPALKDLKASDWFARYVAYAAEKKYVAGFPDKTFRAERPLELAEALKWVIAAYEVPEWQGETKPWYKKYLAKGYELSLLPYGVTEPGAHLTRGELAFMVDKMYNKAKNAYAYY